MIKRFATLLVVIALTLAAGCTTNEAWDDDIYIHANLYTYNGTGYQLVNTSLGGGGGAGSANVTSADTIDNNYAVRGDGGTRGIRDSLVSISDFGVIDTPGDIFSDSDITAGNDLNCGNDLDVADDADIGGQLSVSDDIHILGNQPLKWMDATDTTTKAYIHYDGDITIREIDAGDIILDTGTGNIKIVIAGLPIYANNAAAVAGGLIAGELYRTGGDPDIICVVH